MLLNRVGLNEVRLNAFTGLPSLALHKTLPIKVTVSANMIKQTPLNKTIKGELTGSLLGVSRYRFYASTLTIGSNAQVSPSNFKALNSVSLISQMALKGQLNKVAGFTSFISIGNQASLRLTHHMQLKKVGLITCLGTMLLGRQSAFKQVRVPLRLDVLMNPHRYRLLERLPVIGEMTTLGVLTKTKTFTANLLGSGKVMQVKTSLNAYGVKREQAQHVMYREPLLRVMYKE